MRCGICGNEPPEELVHFPISISGSDGVDICYACKMSVTEFLTFLKQVCARSRIAAKRFDRSYRAVE
jgi:hypothetical protein